MTVCKVETGRKPDLIPIALLRGHERSIECVATKKGSSLVLSGGFDKCLKIWKMESDDTDFEAQKDVASKKQKTTFITKVSG